MFCFVLQQVILCSLGWPWTQSLPTSTSCVQHYTTMASFARSLVWGLFVCFCEGCSFHFYLCVCLYEFMCAMCMEVPTKIRGCPGPVVWIPWNWSHKWIWAAWYGASCKSNKHSLPLSHLSSLAQNFESQGGNEIKKSTVEQLDRDERSFMLTNWDKQSWKGIGAQGCPLPCQYT